MNLHNLVSGLIGTVNPFIDVQMKVFVSESEDDSGKMVKVYAESTVNGQLQALSNDDLRHVDNLNITGIVKKFYVNGSFNGINRPRKTGGDFLIIGDETWMILQVLEEWPDWCSFVIQLQVT